MNPVILTVEYSRIPGLLNHNHQIARPYWRGVNTQLASFTPTIPGTYTVILTVTDDQGVSAIDRVMITVMEDPPPIADAGRDQPQTANNQVVMLDGSASIDPDGGLLTYAWSFESQPTGSQAVLTGANTPLPSFTPNLIGPYAVLLTVTDDQGVSATDRVMITVAEDPPPIADAGLNQPQINQPPVIANQVVALDGGLSTDPNGGGLSFLWSFQSLPPNSQAVLSGETTANPSFTPDVAGIYVISLTVTDDQGVDSPPDTVTITVNSIVIPNQAPTVDAGLDQSINVANGVSLDGTVTDDGLPNPPGTVTSLWGLISGPGTATFLDDTAVDTTVTFSTDGVYVLQLTVDDSEFTNFDEVTITVNSIVIPNQAPTVDAGLDQSINVANGVSLDGTVTDDGLPNPPGTVTSPLGPDQWAGHGNLS